MIKNKLQLSIIVPFYNEEKNIPLVLENYNKIKTDIVFELICVNNGSTDNSQKVFENTLKQKKYSFVCVVTVKKNIGYGYGILQGLKHAKGEVLAWTHADMQTDAKDVFKALKKFQSFDCKRIVVKGVRVKRNISSFLFSLSMAIIASVLLRKTFYEINAQPKLFPKSFLKHFKNPPHDFSLDLYFLLLCKKYRYNIVTIPVMFPERKFGVSKWNYSISSRLRTIIRTIDYILKLKQQKV